MGKTGFSLCRYQGTNLFVLFHLRRRIEAVRKQANEAFQS
jgi:hypothetical protein